ncbi:MAG: threonylcarbamoyl-AMP synthase [Xanthomonadales bacterium]|nr:threonylcarbamoyl-AMP synthase [Xanthomonadales bacterium]
MNTSTPAPAPLAAATLDAAVAALRAGKPVGMPTETVYGLAADARNPEAVARIFALKGRPLDHPVIVHLPAGAALHDYASEVPAFAEALAKTFWPGPLTLILRRQPWVSDAITGGQDTVGLRMPAHPVAQQLLVAFGGGLAAPSANRFGHISPTTATHVRDEFGSDLPIVLDGGPCAIGIESTIVDCSGARPRLLRPGMLSVDAIERVVGQLDGDTQLAPRASGMLEKHYAPRAPLRLVSRAELERAELERGDREHGELARTPHARVIALGSMPAGCSGVVLPDDPDRYARGLYEALRALDHGGDAPILLESPPRTPSWLAIHDRLGRAAAGSGEH